MRAFMIHRDDNVATVLEEIEPGEVVVIGKLSDTTIRAIELIAIGHKIALQNIRPGEPIIKHGVPIGDATQSIWAGGWVHLHNCASKFDERSGTLDIYSGAPTDDSVYL